MVRPRRAAAIKLDQLNGLHSTPIRGKKPDTDSTPIKSNMTRIVLTRKSIARPSIVIKKRPIRQRGPKKIIQQDSPSEEEDDDNGDDDDDNDDTAEISVQTKDIAKPTKPQDKGQDVSLNVSGKNLSATKTAAGAKKLDRSATKDLNKSNGDSDKSGNKSALLETKQQPAKKPAAKKAAPVKKAAEEKQTATKSRAKRGANDDVEQEDDKQPVKKPRARKPAATTKKIIEDEEAKKPAVSKPAARRAPARGRKLPSPPETPPPEPEADDFKAFKFEKVINECPNSKVLTFQGTIQSEVAILRLEKAAFDEQLMKKALDSKDTVALLDFKNDVYSSYMVSPAHVPDLNNIKATLICPANDVIIAKYSAGETILFSETPDAYNKMVEPYIESVLKSDPDYNKWLYNILEGKSEVARVIMNDPDLNSGFMLIPSIKWLGDEKDLYYLAICNRRDIRSLRDLDESHLILLKNILIKGTKAIKEKHKKISQLRTFVHYHPSFYHFHVHFKIDQSASDRDHLLATVINNLTLNKDYYKKSTITYPLAEGHNLYQEMKRLKKI